MDEEKSEVASVDNAAAQFVANSTQVSAITRSLALSALAVVWLFGGGLVGDDATPQALLARIQGAGWLEAALVASLAALLLDLLQYVWGTISWGLFHRCLDDVVRRDRGRRSGDDVDAMWRRAESRVGIVSQIELIADLSYEEEWSERRDRARRLLHPVLAPQTSQAGEQQRAAVANWIANPVRPPLIPRVTIALFSAKVVALVVAFLAIGQFIFFG